MSKIQLKNATLEPHFYKLNLTVDKGTSLAIGGAERRALLKTIAGFHVLNKGIYQLEYHHNETKDLQELAAVRQEKMGFVSEKNDYIAKLTVLENLELPYFFQNNSNQITAAKHQRLEQLSRLIGMHGKLHDKAETLSDYEAKCLSVIRACINSPSILIVEEPETDLTTEEIKKLMIFLRSLKVEGITVIISTSNDFILDYCDQKIMMKKLEVEE